MIQETVTNPELPPKTSESEPQKKPNSSYNPQQHKPQDFGFFLNRNQVRQKIKERM